MGILIVEDVIAVILIASLESIALVGTVSVESVVLVALVAAGLIIGTFTIGRRTIPPLIDKVASAENREILLLSVLGVCFGYALLANVVGLSVAIGAFLAGVLVAESKSSEVSKIFIQSHKRHVCCHFLCISWRPNGYYAVRKLHFHCNCINCSYNCNEIRIKSS